MLGHAMVKRPASEATHEKSDCRNLRYHHYGETSGSHSPDGETSERDAKTAVPTKNRKHAKRATKKRRRADALHSSSRREGKSMFEADDAKCYKVERG